MSESDESASAQPPAKPEKPFFRYRHPYWYAFFIALYLVIFVPLIIGWDAFLRFEWMTLFGTAILICLFCFLPDWFLPTVRTKEEWKRPGVRWRHFRNALAIFLFWIATILLVTWCLPPVSVSRSTTYLTGPRSRQGGIDYAMALEYRFADLETPDNNGFRNIAQMFGKSLVDSMKNREAVWESLAARLGVSRDRPPLFRLPPIDRRDIPLVPEVIMAQARSRPWSSGEFPVLDALLAEWDEPLDLLAAALQKPRFFEPPIHVEGDYLDTRCYSFYNRVRDHLRLRFHLRLGNGDKEAALADLEAMYRLASAMQRSPIGVCHLLNSVAQQMTADRCLALMLEDRDLSNEEIAGLLRKRDDWFRPPTLRESLFVLRIGSLDMMQSMAVMNFSVEGDESYPPMARFLFRYCLWNRAFREVNRFYDDLEREIEHTGTLRRRQQISAFEKSKITFLVRQGILGMLPAICQEFTTGGGVYGTTDESFPVQAGWLFRGEASSRLVTVTAALERYCRENGVYPPSLATLQAAGFLEEVPADPLALETARADFIYRLRPDARHYTLYSVGLNGIDDGGIYYRTDREGIPKEADDLLLCP